MNTYEKGVIDEVEDQVLLYDTDNQHYLNKQLRKATFTMISERLIIRRIVHRGSGRNVKKTYYRLRARFNLTRRNIANPDHRMNAENLSQRDNEIMEKLHFLQDHAHNRDED